MNNSILVAWNESMSSRAALDYLVSFAMCPENVQITLLHVFRKASASEELVGKTFTKDEEKRLLDLLEKTKDVLIEKGFPPENIKIEMAMEPYPTIADGIIDHYKKGKFDMVLIGRKRMSKAEEFVMGDVSVRLVRALETGAVLVVKSR
ncbi:UspA domain protein [uncultured Desulfobacterium sp.]|uniref:UspA domain protein n=1 Tax=uncultured Desulfobacterium sp. TaxID=201089 RepID=A0A445N0Z1_9BACT|nr:UspA domain protein [uncultured Desulfobacterium sp.]